MNFFDSSYDAFLAANDVVLYNAALHPFVRAARRVTAPTSPLSRARNPVVPRYTCVVCLGDGPSTSVFVPSPDCNHPPCICAGCRTRYLNNLICVQGITRVPCPQSGCRQQFSEADIERWGDPASISRYKYLTGIRISAMEHLRSVQKASSSQPPRRDKRADERASTEYISTNTKPCPGCNAPIAKFGDGCDHMKCAPPGGCGFEFCWLCLCDFEPVRQDGNHRHKSSCKHYRAFR